jgi:hypothetical protein
MTIAKRPSHLRSLTVIIPLLILGMLLEKVALAVPAPVATPLAPISAGIGTPVRLAVDPTGNLFLTDPRAGGILRYNGSGTLLGLIATAGSPQGVALSAAGNLVVSFGDHASVLNASGTELFKLGSGAGQFKMANGVALDAAGRIYVTDSLDDCIQVFDAGGAPVAMASAQPGKPANSFGGSGTANGLFSTPTGISYEKVTRQLAVADSLNGRVQFFDLNGNYLKSIGSLGSGPLQFTSPQAISFEYSADAVAQLKRLYVLDSFQSNLQAIDPAGTGTFLGYIGSYGTDAGELMVPTDAAFDNSSGRLYVLNIFSRMSVFGIADGAANSGTGSGGSVSLALSIAAVPASSSSTSVTIGGSVASGARVNVSTNTAALGGAATVAGSTWSFTVTGLAPGANLITVSASDTAGNTATTSATVNYLPAAPALSVNAVPAFIKSSIQTISGTMSAGAVVSVTSAAGTGVSAVSYPTATSWSCELSGLVSGDNPVTVSAAKPGGASASTALVLTLDATAPLLSVSALADGSVTSGQTQNIQVSVSDPHLDKVTVNGTAVAVVNGAFTLPLVLSEGSNTVKVTASDLAGNLASDSRSLTFTPQSAALAIAAPADNSVTGSASLALSGSASPGSQVTLNGTPAQMNGGNWTGSVQLSSGLNTVLVTALDLSGASSTLKRSVVYSQSGPDLAITQPAQDSSVNSTSLVLSGTSRAATSVSASVNGAPAQVSFAGGTFTLNLSLPVDGSYRVAITSLDAAGNATTALRNLIVDTQAPQLSINPVASAHPAQLSGTAEPGALLAAADKNGPTGALSRNGDGSWLLELTGSYDPGSLSLTATDAAGNATTKSPAFIGSTPDGDLDGNGKIDVADALRALQISTGIVTPTANDIAHGDVAPFVNGKPAPDGIIDISDVIMILRKSVGLVTW